MMSDLQIALIQSDLHWENTEANLAMFEEKIWQIKNQPDLIILPEMFTTGFSMHPQEMAEPARTKTFRWMQQQASQTKAVIIGSYIVQENGQFFNRLCAVYPDGGAYFYDKRHLFTLAGEDKDYTAGTERLIIKIKGWRIMPLVCYDLRFPVWARAQKQPDNLYEYDLLLYVANWPKPRILAWDTLLSARAIENTAYCVGVNRTGTDGVGAEYIGHSAAYNYKGEQMIFSEKEEILETSLTHHDLETFRKRFPFQADGDGFLIQ